MANISLMEENTQKFTIQVTDKGFVIQSGDGTRRGLDIATPGLFDIE